MKSKHGIGIQTTCGYQYCGEKHVFVLESYLINLIFHYQYYTIYCIIFCLGILSFSLFPYFGRTYKNDKNYDYEKYFSIAAWRKSGGSCDAKVKVKYQKKIRERNSKFSIVIEMCVY